MSRYPVGQRGDDCQDTACGSETDEIEGADKQHGTQRSRADGSQALVNYGFRFFETRLLFKAGEEISTARVWKSANEYSRLGVLEDLYITVRRGSYDRLESKLDIPAVVLAPLSAGQPVAELSISLDGEELINTPLRALDDNPAGSFWQSTKDTVSLWFE